MQRLLDWFAYALLRLGETLVRSLPPAAAMRLGDACGTVWYLVDGRRRRRAGENLRVAFGEPPNPATRRRLVHATFRSMARVPFESLFMPRMLGSHRRFERRCRLLGDVDRMLEDCDLDRPGVLVTGHLGNWELTGHAIRLYPAPLAVVARPIENKYVNRHVLASRGGRRIVIGRRGALPSILKALRNGTWVGFVADQNAGNQGEFVPFFGLAASTHGAPAWIACREGVALYVGVCLRRPGTLMQFDFHCRRLEHPGGIDATPDDIRELIARSMAQLEAWIRLDPAQYNWLHRRWKDRPKGEVRGPHLPRYDHHRPPAAS